MPEGIFSTERYMLPFLNVINTSHAVIGIRQYCGYGIDFWHLFPELFSSERAIYYGRIDFRRNAKYRSTNTNVSSKLDYMGIKLGNVSIYSDEANGTRQNVFRNF